MKEPDHDLVDEGKTSKFHPKFDGTPLRVLSQGMTWSILYVKKLCGG